MRHARLLAAIKADVLVRPDAVLRRAALGSHLVALEDETGRAGLAALLPEVQGQPLVPPAPGRSLREMALQFLDNPPASPSLLASLGMAAVNVLLTVPAQAGEGKGQDLFTTAGKDKVVAVVGHFPFVERLAGHFRELHVLERHPRPGDLDNADGRAAARVLPGADLVAITATTLLNGTLGSLLEHVSPRATVLVLGPSTPCAPSLLEQGVSILAGAAVADTATALQAVERGVCFRDLPGMRSWILNGA